MKQDSPSGTAITGRDPQRTQAAALEQRVASIATELASLRTILQGVAGQDPAPFHREDNEEQDALSGAWAALNAAVAGLEAATARAHAQGETLATRLLGTVPEPAIPVTAAPTISGNESPGELEAIIQAQRAALDALTEQISAAESALGRHAP